MKKTDFFMVITILFSTFGYCARLPTEQNFTNSIGMKFVRIEPGEFSMGQLETLPPAVLPEYRGRGLFDNLNEGDFDEKPIHNVKITKPFYIGVFEVTNFQYELFDPMHKTLRGKEGFSTEDDEAVINVNWYDAQAFCQWLSHKEGLAYRLPTEAEWEFACRAGTNSNYHTGQTLPRQFIERPKPLLKVGQTQPNVWGLYDMHGNVEEWCYDWYGPYKNGLQKDPVGYAKGDFRVVRGGSHSTDAYYLRSANRMGSLPEDKHWLIGFRVVIAPLPNTKPLPPIKPALNQKSVAKRDTQQISKGPASDIPYFSGPRNYVKIPTASNGPLFGCHNHDPAIVECPNGDLLAVWYTCASERGRELAQAASRLPRGQQQWQPASEFWDVPDRNDHAPALWFDGDEKIYHFTGMSFAGGHHKAALVMRTSSGSGASWSSARIICSEYNSMHKPCEPVFRTNDGAIVLASDWPNVDGYNASGLWMSQDEGLTWKSPGGVVRGIHAGVVQLNNGCLLGYGRPEAWTLPKSISWDMGKTFTYSESQLPSVGGGQRNVLLKLKEGPLFLSGFADRGIQIVDSEGHHRKVYGLYTAVSEDEGETWPYIRLVCDDGPGRAVECTDGGLFIVSQTNAEFRGYLSVCQSLDGLIHLISSKEHYAFNLKWLRTPATPLTYPPIMVKRMVETFTGPDNFDNNQWFDYKSYIGSFNHKGQFTVISRTHHNGINRITGKGSFETDLSIKNIHYNPVKDRVSEGLSVWLTDNRARSCSISFKEDHIKLEVRDIETSKPVAGAKYREGMGWRWENRESEYTKPPESLKLKLIWDENSRRLRILYGLNGNEAVTELPKSKTGIYFGRPFTESTAIYILMSNGRMDLDYYEIKPIKH